MPSNLTCYRVFIASPSGMEDERKAFRDAIQEYNEVDAIARGVYFLPVRWEETLGGVGRPQDMINEEIRESDFFLLMLWDRWGSPPDAPPKRYTSGTEEEFHVALECLNDPTRPMAEMIIFFKDIDPTRMDAPDEQLRQVLQFKAKIEREKTHF